jgi:hypothetical protein
MSKDITPEQKKQREKSQEFYKNQSEIKNSYSNRKKGEGNDDLTSSDSQDDESSFQDSVEGPNNSSKSEEIDYDDESLFQDSVEGPDNNTSPEQNLMENILPESNPKGSGNLNEVTPPFELSGKKLFQSCIVNEEDLQNLYPDLTDPKDQYKQYLEEKFFSAVERDLKAIGSAELAYRVEESKLIDIAVEQLYKEKNESNSLAEQVNKLDRAWFNVVGKTYDNFAQLFRQAGIAVGLVNPNAADLFKKSAEYTLKAKKELEIDSKEKNFKEGRKGEFGKLIQHARKFKKDDVISLVNEHQQLLEKKELRAKQSLTLNVMADINKGKDFKGRKIDEAKVTQVGELEQDELVASANIKALKAINKIQALARGNAVRNQVFDKELKPLNVEHEKVLTTKAKKEALKEMLKQKTLLAIDSNKKEVNQAGVEMTSPKSWVNKSAINSKKASVPEI